MKSNERGQPQARNVVWLEGKIDPAKMEAGERGSMNATSSYQTNPPSSPGASDRGSVRARKGGNSSHGGNGI